MIIKDGKMQIHSGDMLLLCKGAVVHHNWTRGSSEPYHDFLQKPKIFLLVSSIQHKNDSIFHSHTISDTDGNLYTYYTFSHKAATSFAPLEFLSPASIYELFEAGIYGIDCFNLPEFSFPDAT